MRRREDLRHELAVLALWLVAVIPTLLLLRESGLFSYLGPLYFICMVGSVYIVRSARKGNK
jgi:hypothetical protein